MIHLIYWWSAVSSYKYVLDCTYRSYETAIYCLLHRNLTKASANETVDWSVKKQKKITGFFLLIAKRFFNLVLSKTHTWLIRLTSRKESNVRLLSIHLAFVQICPDRKVMYKRYSPSIIRFWWTVHSLKIDKTDEVSASCIIKDLSQGKHLVSSRFTLLVFILLIRIQRVTCTQNCAT